MGLGIARTLLASGFETIGCDLREEVLAEFEQAGGTVVSSPGDIFVKDLHIVLPKKKEAD